jgi:hypothetical protein
MKHWLVSAALCASACAAPQQSGEISVLPGASERFLLAMRVGYLGDFDRAMVPGDVRKVVDEVQLPRGDSRGGRLADYALENGHFLAVVAAVDGTARGGRLLDLARKPKLTDSLERTSLEVLGVPVMYETQLTGFDEATQAAYVELSGRLDLSAQGGPRLTVSTRYDAAPGVDGVLSHTHVKTERAASSEWRKAQAELSEPTPLLQEELFVRLGQAVQVGPEADYGAALGADGGTLLRPLGYGKVTLAEPEASAGQRVRWLVGQEQLPAEGQAVVLSRIFSSLERSDSAALAVALGKARGEELGDKELRVDGYGPGTAPFQRANIQFSRAGAAPITVCNALTTGEDAHFAFSLPAGKYRVELQAAGIASYPVELVVLGERRAFSVVSVKVAEGTGAWSCPASETKRP